MGKYIHIVRKHKINRSRNIKKDDKKHTLVLPRKTEREQQKKKKILKGKKETKKEKINKWAGPCVVARVHDMTRYMRYIVAGYFKGLRNIILKTVILGLQVLQRKQLHMALVRPNAP
jgi:hypothetical protein